MYLGGQELHAWSGCFPHVTVVQNVYTLIMLTEQYKLPTHLSTLFQVISKVLTAVANKITVFCEVTLYACGPV